MPPCNNQRYFCPFYRLSYPGLYVIIIFDQIFNCDIKPEEISCEDPEEYIREKFRGKEFTYDKTVMKDGSIVFEIMTAGIHQRYTFTEI